LLQSCSATFRDGSSGAGLDLSSALVAARLDLSYPVDDSPLAHETVLPMSTIAAAVLKCTIDDSRVRFV
jgi:hypothetical protein